MEPISNNIFIGKNAGFEVTTGVFNVFIGDEAGRNETNISNTLIIKLCNHEIREAITEQEWHVMDKWIRSMITTVQDQAIRDNMCDCQKGQERFDKWLDSLPVED